MKVSIVIWPRAPFRSLNGLSLHWEPDEAPDLAELAHVRSHHPARTMVWEGEPPAETIAALAAEGVGSVVFAPCGNRPEAGDLMTVLATNAEALENLVVGG